MRYLILCFFSIAYAAEPLMLPPPVNDLKMVGAGKLTYFGFHVYDASTWSETGAPVAPIESLAFPFALQIRYAREIDAKDLLDKTRDSWLELGLSNNEVNRWLKQLQTIWPSVNENDVIVCYVNKDEQAEFFVNGVSRGQINDPAFSRAFLAIWLHQHAEFQTLRNQLVGVLK